MRSVTLFIALASLVACSDPPPPVVPVVPVAPVAPIVVEAPDTPVHAATSGRKQRVALDAYTTYDASKNGKELVLAAQAEAKTNSRRVIVMFGGNWCKWCKALDGTFASHAEVKAVLEKGFVLVHVDSDSNGGLNDAWGNPFANGFPVLVVLDADGRKLHVQETGSLEREDKTVAHDPDKVLAFLKQWSPPGG